MLSIVLPSYRDPLLAQTIADLLAQARGTIEIIPVYDGYTPTFAIPDDPRVRPVALTENVGMREAINRGVAAASGEWIMRADEHQRFGEAFDILLTSACEPTGMITPRRYALDPVRWAVMETIPPVDYCKLKIQQYRPGCWKFAGPSWRRPERAGVQVDETMAMQGSCWVMPHRIWDRVIGGLETDGYGPLLQDSHEMVFKVWQAGGRLLVTKRTWHAHKHVSFPRTHNGGSPEHPAHAEASYAHALAVWADYYTQEVCPKWGLRPPSR